VPLAEATALKALTSCCLTMSLPTLDRREWRFCEKCNAMFFNGFPAKGVCAAGGSHSAQGLNFVLPHDLASNLGQPDWRFCDKCTSMFFDGYPTKGVCAAGGGHRAQGFNFVLPYTNS
jgi:hypothetical protein